MLRKTLERFKTIDWFVKENKRMPTNNEVLKMFKLKSTSASHLLLKNYKSRLTICHACKRKI